jgi:CHASE2 domain-containing sensor protein
MARPLRIFISYRREDSVVHAKLIHNELVARFGADGVFMDIADIAYGDDFKRHIDEQLSDCDVVVAVIGPLWRRELSARLDSTDYLRYELAAALSRHIRMIPVLVAGAKPPSPQDLPPDLAGLATINALALEERGLDRSVVGLVEAIRGHSLEDEARELHRERRVQRLARIGGFGIAMALFFAAWVALFDRLTIDTRLASLTLWLGSLGAEKPLDNRIVQVAITEETERHLGRPFGPTWRADHARLIDRLSEVGVRTIAFDLFFEQPTPADEELVNAVLRAQTHGTEIVFGVRAIDAGRPRAIESLVAAAKGWGIACAGRKLGLARSMPLAIEHGASRWPSLALAAAAAGEVEALDEERQIVRVRTASEAPEFAFSVAERTRSEQEGCEAIASGALAALTLLDFSPLAAVRDTAQRLAYEQAADLATAEQLARLRGKIVLVGVEKPGVDVERVSRGGTEERFGIELHAEQLNGLLRGTAIRPLPPVWQLGVMLLLAFGGAWFGKWSVGRSVRVCAGAALAVLVAYALLVIFIYRSELRLMNVPYDVVAFGLGWWGNVWLRKRAKE